MISTSNLSVQFGGRKLFDEVDIKFTPGNCYGIIGPNGAGKSTFLKILTGEAESTSGEVIIDKNKRLSFLKQDHFAYEDEQVLNVVMMGHTKLYDIMMKNLQKKMGSWQQNLKENLLNLMVGKLKLMLKNFLSVLVSVLNCIINL